MIVIEGPDGCGKSTLCQMLLFDGIVAKVLPSPRIPAKGNPERMKYETDRYLRLYGTDNTVAVDRYLFSEMVYGKILRGETTFTQAEYFDKLVQLMMAGSIVVFCMVENPVFKEDENPVVIEKIGQIKSTYGEMIRDQAFTSDKTFVYDWTEPDAFKKLTEFLAKYGVGKETKLER